MQVDNNTAPMMHLPSEGGESRTFRCVVMSSASEAVVGFDYDVWVRRDTEEHLFSDLKQVAALACNWEAADEARMSITVVKGGITNLLYLVSNGEEVCKIF